MKAPDFWTHARPWQAYALAPLALLYEVGRWCRVLFSTPQPVMTPVVCVGNVSVGGTGKTPTVRALMKRAKALGLGASVTTRGYGGREAGPLLVIPHTHTADQVGDEALLLAQEGPVWKATNRALGVLSAGVGQQLVIMDDGMQNPTVPKAAIIMVVDAGAGFGNGWVLPSGPLREPWGGGARRADVIIVIADPAGAEHPHVIRLREKYADKIVSAQIVPVTEMSSFTTVEAVAGIGRPEKFMATLEQQGLTVARQHVFADHHPFERSELQAIIANAQHPFVTTEKDLMRIPPDLRPSFTAVTIELAFEETSVLDDLLTRATTKGR